MKRRFKRHSLLHHHKKNTQKKRATVLYTVLLFGFLLVFVKLLWLMVWKHEDYVKMARRQHEGEKELVPNRGFIYDRKMRELAVNIEMNSLYGEPYKIKEAEKVSRKIAPIVKVPAIKLERKLSGERKFVWLKRMIDNKKTKHIKSLELEGIGFVKEVKRYYPRGSIASHVIGFTNIDNHGLSGVEKVFNDHLKGIPGKLFSNRDARRKVIYKNKQEAQPGDSVILTIDEHLQYVTEKELQYAMEKWRAQAAVSVMMDPNTGEILSLANKPDFNPNFPGKYKSGRRRNRAITDMYEPGSTFKSIVASAALEEKVVSLRQKFDCSRGYIEVGRKRIKDSHKHGILTFQEVIQKSSNVGTIQVGSLLGKNRYYRYMRNFGFGEKTGIELPGEIGGYLAKPARWSGLSLASMSIGQEIGITPLQIVRAYSAIANGGLLMRPYLISKVIDSSGNVVKSFLPEIQRRVISTTTSNLMKKILKTVAEEGGTAVNAAIKGNPVAGKTGTAQMIDKKTGRYSRRNYVSSFIGFVPADEPKFVLLVVIYVPRGSIYGGTVAAPVFRRIAEQALTYLDVPIENHQNDFQIAYYYDH